MSLQGRDMPKPRRDEDDLNRIAEELERMFNRVMIEQEIPHADIPRMIWCDVWDGNHFVRCVLSGEGSIEVLEIFNLLRRKLCRRFKRKFLGVCYVDDQKWNWERAAEQTARLQEVHGGEVDHE